MHYKMFEMIYGEILPNPDDVKVAMKVEDKTLYFDPFKYYDV